MDIMDTSFVAEWATLVKQSYFLNFIYIHNLDRNKEASPTYSIFRNWTEMPLWKCEFCEWIPFQEGPKYGV